MNFPPHIPPGVKKRREKITAASRSTAHPKLLLETAKVAQNLVPFSIVFSVCGKIHWYICFRGLQSTIHIRVSLSLQEYTYEFLGFLLLWKQHTYAFFFCDVISCEKYKKIQKKTLKIHSRYSISIKKNTRIHVKIHMRWFVWANTYVSFISPFDFQNAHTRFVIFLANLTPLTYRASFFTPKLSLGAPLQDVPNVLGQIQRKACPLLHLSPRLLRSSYLSPRLLRSSLKQTRPLHGQKNPKTRRARQNWEETLNLNQTPQKIPKWSKNGKPS